MITFHKAEKRDTQNGFFHFKKCRTYGNRIKCVWRGKNCYNLCSHHKTFSFPSSLSFSSISCNYFLLSLLSNELTTQHKYFNGSKSERVRKVFLPPRKRFAHLRQEINLMKIEGRHFARMENLCKVYHHKSSDCIIHTSILLPFS